MAWDDFVNPVNSTYDLDGLGAAKSPRDFRQDVAPENSGGGNYRRGCFIFHECPSCADNDGAIKGGKRPR